MGWFLFGFFFKIYFIYAFEKSLYEITTENFIAGKKRKGNIISLFYSNDPNRSTTHKYSFSYFIL